MIVRLVSLYGKIVLALLVIVVLVGLYFYNLGGWLIDDDEGSFLYQAWRVSEGERPYTDFAASHWPFFLYTAGALVRLLGRSILAIRVIPVLLTLATAAIVFLLARRFLPAAGASLAALAFLLHPQVFFYGRLLYPEPFMLFFAAWGLYLFDWGWRGRRSKTLAVAGISFGIATLYKPFGFLSLAGCVLWIVVDTWRQWSGWRWQMARAMAFLLPYGLLVGLVFLSFVRREPAFYPSVVGMNLAQGQGLGVKSVVIKGLLFLWTCFKSYLPLMAFALPAAWTSGRENKRRALMACQLPTALAFLALSRVLYVRYLLYLIPSLAILFALALEPLRQWPRRGFLLAAVVCAVLLPWVLEDAARAAQVEGDTDRIAALIRSRTDEGACLLSDYQELNFYAARRSTYLGAEVSYARVASRQITGAKLIEEMLKCPVEMVIVDVSPKTRHHLAALADYAQFNSYVVKNFRLVGRYPRSEQLLEVYVRN